MTGRLVHVVDDDQGMRESLSFLLGTSHGFEVETHGSGLVFLGRLPTLRPGCVLLDIHMPDINGLEVQEQLNARDCSMPVILLTGRADVGLAVRAMKAGAFDFIEKPIDDGPLVAAIEAAFAELDALAERETRTREAVALVERLTPRERDVLEQLLAGHANKMIAYNLGLSARTVEIHRANMMDRLGVRSLSEAIRLAVAAGVTPADDRRDNTPR